MKFFDGCDNKNYLTISNYLREILNNKEQSEYIIKLVQTTSKTKFKDIE